MQRFKKSGAMLEYNVGVFSEAYNVCHFSEANLGKFKISAVIFVVKRRIARLGV